MGQQQRLLLLLAALFVVAAAVATAIMLFSEKRVALNRDGIISDLNSMIADAHAYKTRPGSLGGGGGAYGGYRIPSALDTNDNGYYSVIRERIEAGVAKKTDPWKLVLLGTSVDGYGTVMMEVDGKTGEKKITMTGEFSPQ
jgi:hypothetical protein